MRKLSIVLTLSLVIQMLATSAYASLSPYLQPYQISSEGFTNDGRIFYMSLTSGNYLYVVTTDTSVATNKPGLVVYDMSDLENITITAKPSDSADYEFTPVSTHGLPQMAISGGRLYCYDSVGRRGIVVYDISGANAATPQRLGKHALAAGVTFMREIQIVGNIGYVLTEKGVVKFDVNAPFTESSPMEWVVSFPTEQAKTNPTKNLKISEDGQTAYVGFTGSTTGEVKYGSMVRIYHTATGELLGEHVYLPTESASMYDMELMNGYLYASIGSGTYSKCIAVLDVSDPAQMEHYIIRPTEASVINRLTDFVYSMTTDGERLFVVTMSNQVAVMDIKDPTHWNIISSYFKQPESGMNARCINYYDGRTFVVMNNNSNLSQIQIHNTGSARIGYEALGCAISDYSPAQPLVPRTFTANQLSFGYLGYFGVDGATSTVVYDSDHAKSVVIGLNYHVSIPNDNFELTITVGDQSHTFKPVYNRDKVFTTENSQKIFDLEEGRNEITVTCHVFAQDEYVGANMLMLNEFRVYNEGMAVGQPDTYQTYFQPTTLIVDETGADGAFTTLSAAVAAIKQPNTTVLIKNGEYTEIADLSFTVGGTIQNKIVVKPYPGHSPIIHANIILSAKFIRLEGLYLDGLYQDPGDEGRTMVEGFDQIEKNTPEYYQAAAVHGYAKNRPELGFQYKIGNAIEVKKPFCEVVGTTIKNYMGFAIDCSEVMRLNVNNPNYMGENTENAGADAYIANNYTENCNSFFQLTDDTVFENNESNSVNSFGNQDPAGDFLRIHGKNIIIRNNFYHGTKVENIGTVTGDILHADAIQTFDSRNSDIHNVRVDNNRFYGFYHQGLMAENSIHHMGLVADWVFRNNVFSGFRSSGVYAKEFNGLIFYNNVFVSGGPPTPGESGSYYGIIIDGMNVNVPNAAGVIKSEITGSAKLRNNIFVGTSSSPSYLAIRNAKQIDGDYNLIFNGSAPEIPGRHDLIDVDPKFQRYVEDVYGEASTENDYRLRPDSPCIDRGEAVSFDQDNAGNPRSVPNEYSVDIGAFEFQKEPDPAIAITNISSDYHITEYDSPSLSAKVHSPYGAVTKVAFYEGGNAAALAEVTQEDIDNPTVYSAVLPQYPPGSYAYYAVFTDETGGRYTSESVHITVDAVNPIVLYDTNLDDSTFDAKKDIFIYNRLTYNTISSLDDLRVEPAPKREGKALVMRKSTPSDTVSNPLLRISNKKIEPQHKYFTVSQSVYLSQTDHRLNGLSLRDSRGNAPDNAGSCYVYLFDTDGWLKINGGMKVMPYEANQWYDITVKFTLDRLRFDLYVNGKKVMENVYAIFSGKFPESVGKYGLDVVYPNTLYLQPGKTCEVYLDNLSFTLYEVVQPVPVDVTGTLSLQGTEAVGLISANNISGTTFRCVAVVARYAGGNMTAIASVPISISKDTEVVNQSYAGLSVPYVQGEQIKLLVFDDIKRITPLAGAVCYP